MISEAQHLKWRGESLDQFGFLMFQDVFETEIYEISYVIHYM